MSLNRQSPQGTSSSESNNEYENLAAGEHEGRLVYVADLGFHTKEYQGEFKGNFQNLSLGIEIVGKTFKMDDKEHPVMMWSRAFPLYDTLNEKAGEYAAYKAFVPTAVEGDVPDWEAQLGKPVNVIVTHTKDKKDASKVYDNIGSLISIPTKYQEGVTAATITPSAGNGEEVVKALYGLSKWLFERQLSDDQLGRQHQQEANADAASQNMDDSMAGMDDDIPF